MLSAPARQPASAISRISSSRYNTLPRCRGSSTVVKKSRTVPEALSMTPSAKEGSYESHSLPGRNPKSATVQAIALRSVPSAALGAYAGVSSSGSLIPIKAFVPAPSGGTVNLRGRYCQSGGRPVWRQHDIDLLDAQLCRLSVPRRSDQLRGLPLLSLSVEPSDGGGDAGGARDRGQP